MVFQRKDFDYGVLDFRIIHEENDNTEILKQQNKYLNSLGSYRKSYGTPVFYNYNAKTYFLIPERGEILTAFHLFQFEDDFKTLTPRSIKIEQLSSYGGGMGCYVGYTFKGFDKDKVRLTIYAKDNFEQSYVPTGNCGDSNLPQMEHEIEIRLD